MDLLSSRRRVHAHGSRHASALHNSEPCPGRAAISCLLGDWTRELSKAVPEWRSRPDEPGRLTLFLIVARVSSGNFVRVTLPRGMRRVARRELSRREVGTGRGNALLQFFHI